MKITQKVVAWLPGHSEFGPDEFKEPRKLPLARLAYLAEDHPDMSSEGWIRIGSATITLEVPSLDTVINAKAEGLRAEIRKAKADAARTIAILEDRLSKLLALPCEVSE